MKRKDYLAELKSLEIGDLREKVKQQSEELMKLRFRQATGQLEQQHRIAEVKKELARAKTELSSRAHVAA